MYHSYTELIEYWTERIDFFVAKLTNVAPAMSSFSMALKAYITKHMEKEDFYLFHPLMWVEPAKEAVNLVCRRKIISIWFFNIFAIKVTL